MIKKITGLIQRQIVKFLSLTSHRHRECGAEQILRWQVRGSTGAPYLADRRALTGGVAVAADARHILIRQYLSGAPALPLALPWPSPGPNGCQRWSKNLSSHLFWHVLTTRVGGDCSRSFRLTQARGGILTQAASRFSLHKAGAGHDKASQLFLFQLNHCVS